MDFLWAKYFVRDCSCGELKRASLPTVGRRKLFSGIKTLADRNVSARRTIPEKTAPGKINWWEIRNSRFSFNIDCNLLVKTSILFFIFYWWFICIYSMVIFRNVTYPNILNNRANHGPAEASLILSNHEVPIMDEFGPTRVHFFQIPLLPVKWQHRCKLLKITHNIINKCS